jgi:glyoxylase-like metal-dependent hydrolase (beta-lactamase superfamily II)
MFVVRAALALAAFASLVPTGSASAQPALASYRSALRTIETSLNAHGGLAPIQEAGGVVVETAGTFDLTTRLQGRSPFEPEPTPINEKVSVDLAGDRIAYDIDWSNYKFSEQSLREVYDAEGRVLYIDKRASDGGWPPFTPVPDAKERYKRFLPQFVLADALNNRATLRSLGRDRHDGRPVDVIGYVTAAGDHMTLYVDRRDKLLRGAAHVFDMELMGDTEIRWTWSDYHMQDGVQAPARLQAHLDGELLKDVRVTVRVRAPDEAAFGAPEGVSVSEPPAPEEMRSFADFVPYSQREGTARELAPGIYLAPSVRPGFHMFFVEFDEFVLAVDAPTGWYEMNQIPPYNFVRGEGTSDLAEKYIRTIKKTVPDKPIRYVALTHHHSDHIGGVRPFIAEGATILAGAPAAAAARRAAERDYTLHPDLLTGIETEPKIEIVDGTRVISDGEMEVQLIELPEGNPKGDGFLVVYLPKQKIMYFTSFLYPVGEDSFPVAESVPLSLWFVRWLDQSGLQPEMIYNVHGQARVQDWQLARFREMLASGEHEVAGESE